MKQNILSVCRKRKIFRRRSKWHIVCLAVFFCASILLATAGCRYGLKAENFCHSVTIQSDETGFDMELLKELMEDENLEYTFAAWDAKGDQHISASESGRSDTADVIEIYGSSHCIFPGGKNLWPEDTQGCLIGTTLAEQLFGGHQVEGQRILYNGRSLVIRGIIKEPGGLLICETIEPGEKTGFSRISILAAEAEDGYQKAKDFISRYGFAAQPLRFDLYRDLSWMKELIPGKWSDFAGWEANTESKKREFQLVSGVEKSDLEILYLGWLKKRNWCLIFGICCLSACIYGYGKWKD